VPKKKKGRGLKRGTSTPSGKGGNTPPLKGGEPLTKGGKPVPPPCERKLK